VVKIIRIKLSKKRKFLIRVKYLLIKIFQQRARVLCSDDIMQTHRTVNPLFLSYAKKSTTKCRSKRKKRGALIDSQKGRCLARSPLFFFSHNPKDKSDQEQKTTNHKKISTLSKTVRMTSKLFLGLIFCLRGVDLC